MIELGLYRHYKGGMYEVLMMANCADYGTAMVVYKAVDTGIVWVREADEFTSLVTDPTNVETKIPRFEKVA